MASQIDPTEPQDGNTVTAATRQNFDHANTEITDLQSNKSDINHNHAGVYEPANVNIQSHINNTITNPHQVDKSDVGLSNVDNTSDASKPLSTASVNALAEKAEGAVSSTQNDFAAFADNSGKVLKNSGVNAGSFDVSGAASTVQDNLNTHAALGHIEGFHLSTAQLEGLDASNSPATANPYITLNDFTNGGGHTIQDDGSVQTQRANLNFIGATIADNAGSNSTDVTITGVGGGNTNLDYTPSTTQGVVTSDTGTDATIPAAGANAGLLLPAEKTIIGNTSNTNTGDNSANSTYANDYRAANFVAGTDYEPVKGADDNYVTDAEKVVIGNTANTNTGDQDLTAYDNHIADVTTNPHSVTAAQVGSPESNVTGVTGADEISNMMSLTQAEYDGITPNASTLYFIVG